MALKALMKLKALMNSIRLYSHPPTFRLKNNLILIILLAFLSVLTPFSLVHATNVKTAEQTAIGGDFTLTDHNGNPFKLETLRGKIVLLFFGYTFCPDVCPTELASMSRLLNSLGGDADKVSALFISIDPERDTPEKLKNYVSFFNPKLIGLTGELDKIEQVAKAYHVQRKVHSRKENSDYYLVDHTASLYVLGPQGDVLNLIPFGLPFEHMKKVVTEEVKKILISD